MDCDLKSFFDTVKHDRLMAQLRNKVKDPRVLRLIRRYLPAGVQLPDGTRAAAAEGVPQGGPLSPLLASVARFVEGRLKLVVNRSKSRCAPLKECSFLGFQIGARGKVVWTAKALKRCRDRVREITSRTRERDAPSVLAERRRYLVGWLNYFGISHTYKALLELEEWTRRRVRQYYWKQGKQSSPRRRRRLALGIHRTGVHLAACSHKGCWRMSANSLVQAALSKSWLSEQRVPELKQQWIGIHYPEQAQEV